MFRITALWLRIPRSTGCVGRPENSRMPVCNRLRIDPKDGSPEVDYRIENDRVECRNVGTAAQGSAALELAWQRLTPEQLTSHVMANTVVAYWLSRRLGVHALIRACSQHASQLGGELQRSGYPSDPLPSAGT